MDVALAELLRIFSELITSIYDPAIFFNAVNLPFPFRTLDRHQRLQPCRREDWAGRSRNQASDLLEHILLQDLPRYENQQSDQIYRH